MVKDEFLMEKYFKVAFAVKDAGNGQAVSQNVVKDFIRNFLEIRTDIAIQNNLNYLLAKKFLTRGNMGGIFANPNLQEDFNLWLKMNKGIK